MRRGRWRAFLGGVLATLAAGCTTGATTDWRPHTIVFVTIDTLRADHLGCYGYPRPTSPFIDRLAAEGVLFERAYAAASTTVPSHATLFSGLYPTQHGVRRNGQKLGGGVGLLAEALAAHGWESAGFVSTSGHFVASGLDRGFSHFDEPGRGRGAKAARSAARTVGFAGDWLRARRGEAPLLLWIHVFDPHSPYRPDAPLRHDAAGRGELVSFLTGEHRLPRAFFGGSEALMLELIEAYDGEIRAVDAALERLHTVLGELADRDRTLWIVTSDHGEGLGNHDWLLHGKHIYNEQIRVPLVFHAPGAMAPARIGSVVEHVDLFPTLLDLVGADAPHGAALRSGRSLRPLLSGTDDPGTQDEERFAFSERRSFEARRAARGARSEPGLGPAGAPLTLEALTRRGIDDNYEPGEAFSIQGRRFKLIWNTELGAELYDLEADPYETVDLAERSPELAQSLLERLARRLEALRASAPRDAPEPVAPEAKEALEALGYIDR